MKKLTTLFLMLSLGLFAVGCGAEEGTEVPAGQTDDAPDLAPLPDAATPDSGTPDSAAKPTTQ